jgi:uncharacterized protein (DUF1501 family)
MNRRDFLQTSAALGVIGASQSLFPGWMPRMAFRSAQPTRPGDTLVCIFLRGGMDGLSAVAPYADGSDYYDARPTLAVPEPGRGGETGVDLDGRFALHPALAPLKEIYDEGDLAIVHAAGSIDPSRSHFDAMRFMEFGTPGVKTTGTGWLGRHLQSAAWQNASPFRAIGLGAMIPDSLRGQVSPLSIQSIADFHFKGRRDELNRLRQSLASLYTVAAPTDMLGQQAGLVFETIDILQSLDANNYIPSGGASYPEDEEFGLGLQQVAQLVKADVGLEVACLDLGGWDTHENQGTLGGAFNALLDTLAQGLAAFYADLGSRMQGVTVAVMSEFGRRVHENGSRGTDHGHGNVMFVMGGGVNGGQVFTDWPTLAPDALDDGDLAITMDYRHVLAEIVSGRLLNPALDTIFPGFTASPLGIVKPLT